MTVPDAVLRLDEVDPLRAKRLAFALPEGRIYLDGNSLGALPRAAAERIEQVVRREWGERLIAGWTDSGWIELPRRVGERIAPWIGAASGQVICADSTSVNLHKVLAAALDLRPGRHVVLSAHGNFPTDLYMVQGLQQLLGPARCVLRQVDEDDLCDAFDDDVAAVLLSHVNFRTGRLLPMPEITAAAHEAGALAVFDLAHSAGALPVSLDACGVDFAVGCGYKYLNGGPGAPAFLYAARRHHEGLRQPLSGWMGHRQPFAFDPVYEAAEGMSRFLCGTPPILSMTALDAALDVLDDVDVEALRSKSLSLAQLFIDRVEATELVDPLRLASPRDRHARGSQLSWTHPQAYGICQAWIERGVTADFREPDLLRIGFAPLYNSHAEVWEAVERLRAVLAGGEHVQERWEARRSVT